MKRWQVATSIGAGILALAGTSGLAFWKYSSGAASPEKTGGAEVVQESPKPIPVAIGQDTFASREVSQANYTVPSPEETIVRGNDSEQSPTRPSASFASPATVTESSRPTKPSAGFGAVPFQATISDQAVISDEKVTNVSNDAVVQENSPAEPNGNSSFSSSFTSNAGVGEEAAAASSNAFQTAAPDESTTAILQEAADSTNSAPTSSNVSESPERPAFSGTPNPSIRSSAPRRLSTTLSDVPPTGGEARPVDGRLISPSRVAPQEIAASAELISGAPGERKLEGVQMPSLELEKIAPGEIQVGKPAKFWIKVRNLGQVAAHRVVITDLVPEGTEFIESTPPAMPAAGGILRWELGSLKPGEESAIAVDLMPRSEGEIGSVAEVTFHAQAGVRTIATKPLLTIEHTGPAKVLIGEDVPFNIVVSNPGTGIATGVVVEVDVPDALAHEGGRQIMSDRFDLRPNETRKLELRMKAVNAGVIEHVVRAVADAELASEHRTELEVVAPRLEVSVSGPTRRFLDRQVTYQIALANPGTAPAQNLEIVAHLPQGLKFVATEKKGEYDQRKHAVRWSLEELPAGESGTVQLSAIPIDTGEQKLHIEAHAALDLAANYDHTTLVEALSELVFTVADENDPIEVGAETTYEIRVTNNGSRSANNVRVAALLPNELELVDADGPTAAEVQGQQVVMEPLPVLESRQEVIYRIAVRGQRAGDHLIRVQVLSDESSTPVTKEEGTKVYADE